jgi:hypothetical protein
VTHRHGCKLIEIEGDRKVFVREQVLKVKTDNDTDAKLQRLSESLAARRAEAEGACSIGRRARLLLLRQLSNFCLAPGFFI